MTTQEASALGWSWSRPLGSIQALRLGHASAEVGADPTQLLTIRPHRDGRRRFEAPRSKREPGPRPPAQLVSNAVRMLGRYVRWDATCRLEHSAVAVDLRPATGEALQSWVDRSSAAPAIAPGTLVEAMGFDMRVHSARPVLFGVAIRDDTARQVAAATGLARSDVASMHLSRYNGLALNRDGFDTADGSTLVKVVKREWDMHFHSRACPGCVRSDAAWPLLSETSRRPESDGRRTCGSGRKHRTFSTLRPSQSSRRDTFQT